MQRTYRTIKQVLFYLILASYILLLAKTLLFKTVSPFDLFNSERVITRTHNFVPFHSILEYLSFHNVWIALMNVLGNIVIFIPLGIYLQTFGKAKTVLKCVLLVCAFSLCIETVQILFGIGAFDIDDILLNTVGGLLGVLLYRLVYSVLKDKDKTKTAFTFFACLLGALCLIFFAWMRLSGRIIRLF